MSFIITIVTPTFNCEKYIARCIESVESQGLTDKIKHIIIDGMSTDRTCEIVKNYKNVDLISENDFGQSDAFNKGILSAKSDWIVLLDGDDEFLPGSLKRYLDILNKKSPDLIYGHQSFVDQNSNIIKTSTSIKYKKNYALNGLFIPPSSGLGFKASVIKNQLFDINHHYNMDTEWFLRYKKNLSSVVIPYATTAFRVWSGSKTFSLTRNLMSNESIEENKDLLNERDMLNRKYYEPYKNKLGNNKILVNFKILLIYLDFLINKIIMKSRYKLRSILTK